MKKLFYFFFASICLFAESPVEWKAYSEEQMEEWLDQFDLEDQPSARKLVSYIDYYSLDRTIRSLKRVHEKLIEQLRTDGFDLEGEDPYEQVDFSRLYCAKSGDVVSYFYRQANKLRAASFKNLSDLILDGKTKENRALVLLEDYIGTGTQFLWENYVKFNHELFNQYRKVYFVAIVANELAIERFEQLKKGRFDEFANFLQKMEQVLNNAMSRETIIQNLGRVKPDRLQLIYGKKEVSLFERDDIPQLDRDQVERLISKYTPKSYLEDLFFVKGSTVFFFNCPNNVPNLLWNTKNGPGWKPLFYRYEDLSVYDSAKKIPIAEQTW